jgi:hypothetical protein
MSYDIPVLLITYKRFDSTLKIVNVLKEIGVNKLYVSSNAPNLSKNPSESQQVERVRSLFLDKNWQTHVVKNFRNEHLRAKDSIKSSIDWFFEHEEYGVILEDDTLPQISFFQYMKKYLTEYKNEDCYGVVCGYNILNRSSNGGAFLSRYPHIWGWGTWRRVWKSFEVDKNYSDESLRSLYGVLRLKKHQINSIIRGYKKIKNGLIDTWDMQFGIYILENNYLCIYPKNNLIINIGFDSFATNTKGPNTSVGIDKFESKQLEDNVVLWDESDRLRFDKEIPSFFIRIMNKLLKLCKMS